VLRHVPPAAASGAPAMSAPPMREPAILASLRAAGVILRLDGDRVRFSAPPDTHPDLLAEARTQRSAILAALKAEASTAKPAVPPAGPLAAPIPAPRPYRQPSWSDITDVPDAADTCSACRGSSWWTERHNPRGWRCSTCHPPLHLAPDAVRHAPPQDAGRAR
jgi:hypothetical protein